MPTTWRVQYFRKDSPHPYPVSIYLRGEDAESKAQARAQDLRQSEAVRGVAVDPIEPPADAAAPRFSPSDLLATAPTRTREKK